MVSQQSILFDVQDHAVAVINSQVKSQKKKKKKQDNFSIDISNDLLDLTFFLLTRKKS